MIGERIDSERLIEKALAAEKLGKIDRTFTQKNFLMQLVVLKTQ